MGSISVMSGRIVIQKDDAGKLRFNVLDDDGTVLASSKGFDDLDGARSGLERHQRIVAGAEVVDQTGGDAAVRASSDVASPER